MVFTLLVMPILIGVAALAIDTGLIYAARTQIQNAADGAALAAMAMFRSGGLQAQAPTTGTATDHIGISTGSTMVCLRLPTTGSDHIGTSSTMVCRAA